MIAAEAAERRRAMLRTAMGPAIAAALADPLVVEVMVNPDGALRLDRLDVGRGETGLTLSPDQVERIIRLVASHVRSEVHGEATIVSAELPPHGQGAGERFEGLLPPVSLLGELAARDERVILIEDTRELQCPARDTVALRTRPRAVAMADLVRSTLRLRPDRIVVGEVRGGEALDMLKAWNTGHPGGIATVHANGALAALYRLEQLVQEAIPVVPRRLIAEAIDLVVFIEGRGTARRVGCLAAVEGVDSSGD